MWSPDGTRVAFASDRDGGVFDIYEIAADGSSAPRSLYKSPRSKKPVQWSRDGWLLFDESGAMFALRLGTNQPPLAIGPPNRQAEFARLSPDGQWIAYAAQETDRLEIFLERFPTSAGRVPVSTNGGTRPHWRADGRELSISARTTSCTRLRLRQVPLRSLLAEAPFPCASDHRPTRCVGLRRH